MSLDPGREAFDRGDLVTALSEWLCRRRSLEYVVSKGEAPEAYRDMLLRTLLNLALVSSRLEMWGECVAHCDEALALDPGNVKAMYRRK